MKGKRMSLLEGLERDRERVDPATEASFVKHGTAAPPDAWPTAPLGPPTAPAGGTPPRALARPSKVRPVGLIPVTVRLRPEVAGALKRASLERQLAGEEPSTQQGIVEDALEPWLRREGYLD